MLGKLDGPLMMKKRRSVKLFQLQLELAHEYRKHGRKIAVELLGDMHEYTQL